MFPCRWQRARSHQSYTHALAPAYCRISSDGIHQLTQVQHHRAQNDLGTNLPLVARPFSSLASASRIPFIYQLWHLRLEPLVALSGVYQLHWQPSYYFEWMPQTSRYSPESQIVYHQFAASYLLFAVVEALIPRVTNDVEDWMAVVLALLLSDAGHTYASWVEMGTRHFFCPWLWQGKDTIWMITFVAPSLLRAAFLLEVGLSVDNEQRVKQ